jgi:hypothetical protein
MPHVAARRGCVDFKLELNLGEGWYDDIDFEECVRESCKKAVRDYVRTVTIDLLERDSDINFAVQKMLDNEMKDYKVTK